MSCLSCASGNQGGFGAEINIHFLGPQNIDRPGVWAFPKLLICLDCGFSRFYASRNRVASSKGPMTDELSALTNRSTAASSSLSACVLTT